MGTKLINTCFQQFFGKGWLFPLGLYIGGLLSPANEVWGYIGITPVCLSDRPSVRLSVRLSIQSKLNLDHYFLTKGDRALILHKCIPCNNFLSIPKYLTSWPWLLTYFWKTLTLAITFEPKKIRLSYFTCVFLVARPFCWNLTFLPCDLDLFFWPTFEKNLTLGITFEPKEIGLSYFHRCISCGKTFLL